MTGTREPLQLSLGAKPESVGRARRIAAEEGHRLGMRGDILDALRTVVSEAAANVVRHAYPHGGGTLVLTMTRLNGELAITIRDFGVGLRPQIEAASSLRLGLGLIATLSSHYEIYGHADGGTEIRIRLPISG
jgi:anti-sigma regulatory factor (Ser/Thr protein kinase)